ncbi:hypothetical protein EZV62_018454 [Acer yangbiense]|uniref:RNase H type-1 domain-containing protein n=1 Tax=Acer yangbiense TaxID=1000413 RepID=A0A5C7HJF2_9ROSI|nr:hypothetical protein EZV62_018454 [Acer yangbiense]
MAGLFNPDELGQACMLIWAVWEDRNSFVNTSKAKEPESVVARANVMLEEFKDSVQVFSPPPSIPTFRISRGVGVGATIRDSKGMVLAVRSNRILGSFSKEIGHLLALREGLMLAIRLRFPVSIAECSYTNIVAALGNHRNSRGTQQTLLISERNLRRKLQMNIRNSAGLTALDVFYQISSELDEDIGQMLHGAR